MSAVVSTPDLSPSASASMSALASTSESMSISSQAFTKLRDEFPNDEDDVSDTQSESSSRSVTPEPRRPSQAKVKRPPFPFEYGECRLRKMLPRAVLPRRLDPRCVAIQAPTDLPLCWLGVPFSLDLMENYANSIGLSGSVDLLKTWLVVIDDFLEDTGITLDIKDVWGADPIIAFISNRQTCDITMDQHEAIEDILEDMGVKKKHGPKWYLDRRELY